MTKRTSSRMWSVHRVAVAFAGLVAIAAAGGCTDDGLDRLTAPAVEQVSPNADLVAADPWIDAIEDALTRIVPALADPADAEPLRATLTVLQTQLEAGNTNGAAGTIAAVERLIQAYEQIVGPDSSDAQELDAIRLAIGTI